MVMLILTGLVIVIVIAIFALLKSDRYAVELQQGQASATNVFQSSSSSLRGATPPRFRSQHRNLFAQRDRRAEEKVMSGYMGAGVNYKQDIFKVTNFAELDTEMIVHPDGLGIDSQPILGWIFTPATNRSEKGAEVLGIYSGLSADVAIFDWSCSLEYPCSSGATGPAYVWTQAQSSLGCYYAKKDDGGGHSQDHLRYKNSSTLTGGLWTNSVGFYNYCTSEWEKIYAHEFSGSQTDCSLGANICGWWGPIIEIWIDGDVPAIKELGFLNSTLTTDGNGATLFTDKNSVWITPLAEWTEFHRLPNYSWGVGTFSTPKSTPTPSPLPALTIIKLTRNEEVRGQMVNETNAKPGERVRFQITIANTGLGIAKNVVVDDILPAQLVYKPNTTIVDQVNVSDGITAGGIKIGTIEPGQSKIIAFNATVKADAQSTRVTNSAGVDSSETTRIQDTAFVNIEKGTSLPLTVSMATTPTSGAVPLTATSSVTVSGTTTGPIDYNFWFNCNNSTIDVPTAVSACGGLAAPSSIPAGSCSTNKNGIRCNDVTFTSKTFSSKYTTIGSKYPKVIIQRAASNVEYRNTVTVR